MAKNSISLFLLFVALCSPLRSAEKPFFFNHEPLAHVIAQNHVRTAIEVGSWRGESAICIAENLPQNGKLYAIDSWIGYPQEIYKNGFRSYEIFLSNIAKHGLSDKIIPIRMTSLSAARLFGEIGEIADLVYIDGDHSYEAVYSDIVAWSAHLKPGGVLCGNLYSPAGETKTIKAAVQKYCKKHNKKYEYSKFFWTIK